MNELAIIDTMDPEQLQILHDRITEKRFAIMQDQLIKVQDKLNELEERQESGIKVAINAFRSKQSQYNYISQKDFGNLFTVSIGSKTVGKLLKVVGLAQKSRGNTIPYNSFIPKFAKVMANEQYSAFVWQYENCLSFIENWLHENNLYEEFYSMATERDLESYINELYDAYGN